MLKLICGSDRLKNSAALIDEICANAELRIGGQILIVPEQYSHETERALCAAGGDQISRYAEVLSFSRLASRVFSLYGGVCEEYLDKGGRFLSMYLAVQHVRPQIKYYAAVSMKTEFLLRLCSAAEEFLNYGVQPESLRAAAAQLSGSFAQKLSELALIYESYLAVCKTGRSDPVTRLTRLEEMLRQSDYAADKTVYLDGFSDFTAVEMQILTELMKRAQSVTMTVASGNGVSAFRTANETLRQIKNIAARWNIPVETQQAQMDAPRAKILSDWLDGLFAARFTPSAEETKAVWLHHASSPEDECRFAAWRVRNLVMSGARYRDICIALSDTARYEPVLRRMLARSGIPAYFAGNSDILQKPLFAAILSAMDAVERFSTDSMLTYLKSQLSPLAPDACDQLERYVFTWNVRGKMWLDNWTMHPKGYGAPWDDASRQMLNQLNEWRAQGVAPLAALRGAWNVSKTAGQMIAALDDFCEQTAVRQTLAVQTVRLEVEGQMQQAQEVRQLYEILMQAMEQLNLILGTSEMDSAQFTQVFRMLLSQYSVGTIPASVDEVQIGAVSAFRHKCAPHLIVLGAEEGLLPSFTLTAGIFTEAERQTLTALSLNLSPGQEQSLSRELGWIYSALCAACESCALCYSGNQPSFLYTRTESLLPNAQRTTDNDVIFAVDISEAAAALLQGGQDAGPALAAQVDALRAHSAYDFTPLDAQTVHGMYGHEIQLSASRIDRFAGCRFAFFMNYGLKAELWRQARFDAPLFGTFVHYVLEKTVDEVSKNGGFAVISDEALQAIARRHAENYTCEFLPDLAARGERFSYLYTRNMDEALSVVQDVGNELRESKFLPRSVELPFSSEPGGLPPVRVESPRGAGVLSGFVDRVDLYQTVGGAYYRVVDYKTGHKDFDYADILCGQGLQMLIYLFALRRSGADYYGEKLFPAGVLYVPARTDMERVEAENVDAALEKAREKHRRRKGLVLDDAQVLYAMEQSDTPKYLPYQVKKGENTGDLASREQLTLLEQFVQKSLADVTNQILSGALNPNPIVRGPMVSSCTWCDFKETCHRDSCRHDERPIRSVKPDEFWQEVERRCRNG